MLPKLNQDQLALITQQHLYLGWEGKRAQCFISLSSFLHGSLSRIDLIDQTLLRKKRWGLWHRNRATHGSPSFASFLIPDNLFPLGFAFHHLLWYSLLPWGTSVTKTTTFTYIYQFRLHQFSPAHSWWSYKECFRSKKTQHKVANQKRANFCVS